MTSDRNQTTYRRASVDDIAVLTRLRLLLLAEISTDGREPTHLTEAIGAYFQRTISTGEFVSYLALQDGRVIGVGGMVAYELPPTGRIFSGKVGCVVTMYAQPAARRKGTARRILELLIAEARDRGLSRIHLRATDEGIGLYRQVGFSEPRFLEMELALDPTPQR